MVVSSLESWGQEVNFSMNVEHESIWTAWNWSEMDSERQIMK